MQNRRSYLLRSAVLAALFANAACYSYTTASPVDIAPGSRVAVDLTHRAAADGQERFGSIMDRLEGIFVSSTPDSVRLQVSRARVMNGGWNEWARETVTLPMTAAAGWSRRRFSGKRTAIAALALGVVAYQILTGSLFGSGGHDPDPAPKPLPPVSPGIVYP